VLQMLIIQESNVSYYVEVLMILLKVVIIIRDLHKRIDVVYYIWQMC